MPKLLPGEIAPSIAAISNRKIDSVRNILQVLEKALSGSPSDHPMELDAFKSYRQLCKWKSKKRGIMPMAEATLRKHIDAVYRGGIRAFERDRQKLLEMMRPTKQQSKTSANNVMEELKKENKVLANHILMFSAQYLDLLEKASEISQSHHLLKDALKKHSTAYPGSFRGLQIVKRDE